MKTKNWRYVDVWNMIAPNEFTNSAVHVTPNASRAVAAKVGKRFCGMADGKKRMSGWRTCVGRFRLALPRFQSLGMWTCYN